MVSHAEDDSTPPHPNPSSSLPSASPRIYEVIVPVFLKVSLRADDELHAEVLALNALRHHSKPQEVGCATVKFHAPIALVVR